MTRKFVCPWKWKFSTDTLFLEGSQLPAELHKKSFLRIWAHFSRRKKVKCASQRQSPEKYFLLILSLSTKVQIDSYPRWCQTDFEVLQFLNYRPFKNLRKKFLFELYLYGNINATSQRLWDYSVALNGLQ